MTGGGPLKSGWGFNWTLRANRDHQPTTWTIYQKRALIFMVFNMPNRIRGRLINLHRLFMGRNQNEECDLQESEGLCLLQTSQSLKETEMRVGYYENADMDTRNRILFQVQIKKYDIHPRVLRPDILHALICLFWEWLGFSLCKREICWDMVGVDFLLLDFLIRHSNKYNMQFSGSQEVEATYHC